MSEVFSFPIRIYYEDTDFSGNVYHGAYIRFFERSRTEWLRDLGIHHFELAKQGLAFAVAKMEIDFIRAAKIDDLLLVSTKIIEMKGARVVFEQDITCNNQEIARAKLVVALINEKGRATRLPKEWREIMLPNDN